MKKKDKIRILENQIFFLESKGTKVVFTNINECPMYTYKDPMLPGTKIVINQMIRGKFEGKVINLKRKNDMWIMSVHIYKRGIN